MSLPTLKFSTIFVATAEGTRVFRSVEEMPPSLRQTLRKGTHRMQSATILIADRNGREEVARAIKGLPSRVSFRAMEQARTRQTLAERIRSRGNWIDLGLLGSMGLLIWLLSSIK